MATASRAAVWRRMLAPRVGVGRVWTASWAMTPENTIGQARWCSAMRRAQPEWGSTLDLKDSDASRAYHR
jgi:hypothetical protein